MHSYYLILLLIPPLLVAFILFFLGMEERKESEAPKALFSRVVYYIQFFLSIAAAIGLEEKSDISFNFVHLKEYHFDIAFSVKTSFLWFAALIALVFIIIERLSYNYLHAEEEHSKFYGLKLLMNFAVLSFIFGTNIDFLFFNWEIVGISSALLISYFYRRNQAVEHSLFAFSIYRLCDASFLLAGLFLYYFYHSENILLVTTGTPALILGGLVFLTIMGKSGIWPFSSWLPLALEGPTPSSNLYYMTLATHMGVLFLLKTHSLWDSSSIVKIGMTVFLILNIYITTMSARVQTTIKGALAYSALAQVSLILIEVVHGFHTFALIHMSLHILYRLTQMTNSPSIIDQHNLIEIWIQKNIDPKPAGIFYFRALTGFGSERFVRKFFMTLLKPFVFLDQIENILLKSNDKERPKFKQINHGA